MTNQLAISYLAAGHRPRGAATPARAAHVTEHDAIDARPAIPQAVVAWTDAEALELRLPAGAGDPATAISGPPSFSALRLRPPRPAWKRRTLDSALLGALGALLIGLAGVVAWQLDQPAHTWTARDTDASTKIALAGRVPVVELRVIGYEPVATPSVAMAGND